MTRTNVRLVVNPLDNEGLTIKIGCWIYSAGLQGGILRRGVAILLILSSSEVRSVCAVHHSSGARQSGSLVNWAPISGGRDTPSSWCALSALNFDAAHRVMIQTVNGHDVS